MRRRESQVPIQDGGQLKGGSYCSRMAHSSLHGRGVCRSESGGCGKTSLTTSDGSLSPSQKRSSPAASQVPKLGKSRVPTSLWTGRPKTCLGQQVLIQPVSVQLLKRAHPASAPLECGGCSVGRRFKNQGILLANPFWGPFRPSEVEWEFFSPPSRSADNVPKA